MLTTALIVIFVLGILGLGGALLGRGGNLIGSAWSH